jgi:DHA2 family multidrug resistance protein
MSRGQLILATIVLALSNFMVVLDITIANVSIPTIAGNLGASVSQGTWVITSYAVAEAIILPLTGWLSQRFGIVRLLTMAMLSFAACSLACGLSPTLGSLVFFRVLQGIAGAPMMPLAQTLLFSIYPREKAGIGSAIFAMTTLLAPVSGPVLGGYISDNLHWSWIFLINVPVGLICSVLIWRTFRSVETAPKKVPVDFIGLGLLVLAVGSLQLMLDKGKELDWFGSPLIVTLAILAVVGFCFLIVWELGERNPVVDLRLFRNRNFTMGTLSLAIVFAVYFGSVVLTPLWLQTTMGYTATWAGYAIAPIGFLSILVAPIVARNAQRFDLRLLVTIALLIIAATFVMRAQFTTDADYWTIALPQFLQGSAMAMFFIPLNMMAMSALTTEQLAAGSGLMNFVRTLGAAFSTSLVTTYWDNQTVRHHAGLTEHLTVYDDATNQFLQGYSSLGLDAQQSAAVLDRMVSVQATTMALTDYFTIGAVILLGLIALIWFARPVRGAKMQLPGH